MFVLEFILGSIFRIAFFILLLLFHPLQMVASNLLGTRAHQKVVHYLNGGILLAFRLAGTRCSFTCDYDLPKDKPLVFVANHQSLWDIIGIYWYLRAYFPLFVSKIELSKGIPSISYNLRKSGSALIDRNNRRQAIVEILKMATKAKEEKRSIAIFPEGTRSKDGVLKRFSVGGMTSILKKCPDCLVVPLAINGTARLEANKYYRIKAFKRISWTVLQPIDPHNHEVLDLVNYCQSSIEDALALA